MNNPSWQLSAIKILVLLAVLLAIISLQYPQWSGVYNWFLEILPSLVLFLVIGAICASLAYAIVRDHKIIIFGFGIPATTLLAFLLKYLLF